MLCTVPDRGTAERLAGLLVEQELAACVNLSAPITSIYRWQGKTEQS
ncbi:MAG: divalent-cation tolerance protein CutA, partial [Candidatus Thiodiazotropha taylori]|nr:divalent-cation tolerance protein CutA [Candidatus Thiodiazotropha taylori]MCW4328038.1 divalent-cation tolerance protein CutA [Candidatus Thiodiazotropha taylori]